MIPDDSLRGDEFLIQISRFGHGAGGNPLEETSIDTPFTVSDAVLTSFGPNAGLLVVASPYCALLLTETGHITTLDSCAD